MGKGNPNHDKIGRFSSGSGAGSASSSDHHGTRHAAHVPHDGSHGPAADGHTGGHRGAYSVIPPKSSEVTPSKPRSDYYEADGSTPKPLSGTTNRMSVGQARDILRDRHPDQATRAAALDKLGSSGLLDD